MSKRKCIYTGEDAGTTDHVIPKHQDENTLHSWANKAPVNLEYKNTKKKNRLPTDLEMEANRLFHLLELAKLDVTYLEARLKQVQSKITGKKAEEINKAYHTKELDEAFQEAAPTILKNMWEDE